MEPLSETEQKSKAKNRAAQIDWSDRPNLGANIALFTFWCQSEGISDKIGAETLDAIATKSGLSGREWEVHVMEAMKLMMEFFIDRAKGWEPNSSN